MPADPRDGDDAVFERLAEGLQHRAWKLGQLVEQEHATVRERDLARTRARTASDDRGSRSAVMRRAKRGHGDERPVRREEPGNRVDAGDLERLLPRQRREDSGQPPGEHRLARARRTCEQQVVRARGRDLESAACSFLAPHVRQVGNGGMLESIGAERVERRSVDLASEVCDDLAEMANGHGLDSRECGLGRRLGCADHSRSPARRAPSATASAPATGRTRPSSASSPTAACSASRSGGICRVAARTASEIGRSKPDPSFRNAAGARLTVIRRFSGHSSDAETTPLRTRCFASWQARSASPTIANPGTPAGGAPRPRPSAARARRERG